MKAAIPRQSASPTKRWRPSTSPPIRGILSGTTSSAQGHQDDAVIVERCLRTAIFGGRAMVNRMASVVVVWLLLLATAWVAEPYVVAALFSDSSPRPVTPRGNL